MAQRPSKVITYLLIVWGIVFVASVTWFVSLIVFRDRNPILVDFIAVLQERSKELAPGARIAVPLPPLVDDELIVVIMGPYAAIIPTDIGLSDRTKNIMLDDTGQDGSSVTILYLVDKGDTRKRERVSSCNLALSSFDALVIRPANKIVFLECAPILIPSRPGECSRVKLWNDKCTARFVIQ